MDNVTDNSFDFKTLLPLRRKYYSYTRPEIIKYSCLFRRKRVKGRPFPHDQGSQTR